MKNKDGGRLRVAILGAGGIAETHAQVLARLPNVERVGICDMQLSKAEAFRAKMGLPAAYGRLETMLEEAKPDVVHLVVSPSAHAATALTSVNAGAHVFVEKPFCLTTEDCARVTAAAGRAGVLVGVNHNMVFHPTVDRAIQAARAGRLGAVEHVTIGFFIAMPELPSGPYSHFVFHQTSNLIFELGVHPLSVIHRLLGRTLEVKTLCSGERTLPSGVKFYSTWQIALRCERGTATLLLSLSAGFNDMWMHVQGEDAVCHSDVRRNTFTISEKSVKLEANSDLMDALKNAGGLARDGVRHYKNYILSSLQRKAPYPLQYAAMESSISAFYDALHRGVKPPMGAAEGTDVVASCEAIAAEYAHQSSPLKDERMALHG